MKRAGSVASTATQTWSVRNVRQTRGVIGVRCGDARRRPDRERIGAWPVTGAAPPAGRSLRCV